MSKEKTIGILGGMGPGATLELYSQIIEKTPAGKDQDHLRVIIDSNPKIPDRSPAILDSINPSPVPEMLLGAKRLEKSGVDFIVIPCMSAHFFLDELEKQLRTPILSAFDQVGWYLRDNHPRIKRIGLLATTGTVVGGKFAEALRPYGISTLRPDEADQERVMDAIYRIKGSVKKQAREEAREQLIQAARGIISRGADGFIAGCTEIPLVLRDTDLQVPLFNTLHILAEAAVRKALGGIPD